MTKAEEIRKFMLETLASEGYEDTPENRLRFLEGVREAWTEDVSFNSQEKFIKALYMIALTGEISIAQIKVRFAKV